VLKFPAPLVRVTDYGDFAVHFEIRYPINDFAAHVEIETEIMNLLWYKFKRSGIEIPYPVRSVHVQQITPETRRIEQERKDDELLGMLEKVEIFSPLSKTELKALVALVSVRTYSAGVTGRFLLYYQERPGGSGC
jgi:hypothetical protein